MKCFYVILIALLPALQMSAADGDTTWVQAHNDVQMPNYGNYNESVVFPDGSKTYRRIYMIFTLGRYQCPGNPQYCGDWDYTVRNFLMTPGGDTLELGRLITPYAGDGNPGTPTGWKQRYTFDVTDFYPLLKNNADIRVHYSGYSGGFTSNIKFAFIEGTPARNVTGITRLWHGSFKYGKSTDPIEDHVMAVNETAPSGTKSAEMKMNITGHGADDSYCSEFCSKYYQVKLDGNIINQTDIWKDDCGFNNLYNQNGTWIYDRGNWCPGEQIAIDHHKLPGITAGKAYSIDVDFEPYTGSTNNGGSQAIYIVEGAVFYYGDFNRQLDASLEDIIAPTNHEAHFRENPTNATPMVRVKNTGATTINSVTIEYGMPGKFNPQHTWSGIIEPMQEVDITLPSLWELRSETGTNMMFNAKIVSVNGVTDGEDKNNSLHSYFDAAPQWPDKMIITFRTNKATTTSGASETSYRLYDATNNIVHQRTNNAASTTYIDTLQIGPGSYKLVVEDEGCDGLSWWANPNAGTGSIQVKKYGSIGSMPLKGYFSGDFGCGFTQYFNMDWPTTVMDANAAGLTGVTIFPNPASEKVVVDIQSPKAIKGTVIITDVAGRVVMMEKCNTARHEMNVASLMGGVYSIAYSSDDNTINYQTKLVITK